MRLGLTVAAAMLALPAVGQFPSREWRTDVSKRSIELRELVSGGPPKDGIPSINSPRFEEVMEAGAWLDREEPVMLVEHGGVARASTSFRATRFRSAYSRSSSRKVRS